MYIQHHYKIVNKFRSLTDLHFPDSETWIKSHSLPKVRHYHSSWTPASGSGTYLLGGGGGNNGFTSNLVKPDGTVHESFPLKHNTV